MTQTIVNYDMIFIKLLLDKVKDQSYDEFMKCEIH